MKDTLICGLGGGQMFIDLTVKIIPLIIRRLPVESYEVCLKHFMVDCHIYFQYGKSLPIT